MVQAEAGAGPELQLIAGGNGDRKAGGKEAPFPRRQQAVLGARNVEPGAAGSGPGRERQPFAVGQPLDLDVDQSTLPTLTSGRLNASATPG